MSGALHAFHFLHPYWLLGLLALPLLLWSGMRGNNARRALSRLVDAELLPHLTAGAARDARWPAGLFALGWTLCVLALAGPAWSRVPEPMYTNRAAQVVALSLSQHMLAKDVAPSRIERARYKVRDLLAANRDGLNALIGYAGQSFVVAPLTSDAHSLDDLLGAMAPDTMPVDGDNAAQAIAQGVQLIESARLGGGSLVLVTDDADTDAQAAARKALAAGVHVSVLGIGSAQGAPVPQAQGGFMHDDQGNIVIAHRDDADLRALAQAGGGRYVAMSDNGGDIAALQAELHPASSAARVDGRDSDVWQDRGPWLLLPLLVVAALAFRRGWILLLPLILLPMWPTTATASGWPDWWQRPDQQAASALRRGDAAQAQQLARDPAWRGAAAYRAGHYAAAAQALEQAKGADAPYNLGNALARLGRYPEAIKAYDRALQLNPHNDDALANRKAVADAMRKRQQASPPPSSSSGQGGQDKQQKQGSNASSPTGQNKDSQSAKQQGGTSGQHQDGQPDHGQSPDAAQQRDNATSGKDSAGHAPAAASSSEQAQTAKAQQALAAQMNRALAQAQNKTSAAPPTHELGVAGSDDPLSKLPDDVRRELQRVPDDPGALLRRKFELEYRERMGASPAGGVQP